MVELKFCPSKDKSEGPDRTMRPLHEQNDYHNSYEVGSMNDEVPFDLFELGLDLDSVDFYYFYFLASLAFSAGLPPLMGCFPKTPYLVDFQLMH